MTLRSLLILLHEVLPVINPAWSLLIIQGKTISIHRARVLDNSLRSVFNKLIGLLDAHLLSAFPFFSVRLILASVIDLGRDLFFNDSTKHIKQGFYK